MKWMIGVFGLLFFAVGCSNPQGPAQGQPAAEGPFLRVHFAGLRKVEGDTNSVKLREVFGLNDSRNLKAATISKLATAPQLYFSKAVGHPLANVTALLQPLVAEALEVESFFEMNGATNQADWVFGAALSEERAKFWQTNLVAVLTAWKLGSLQPGTNWVEAANDAGKSKWRFAYRDGWFLLAESHGNFAAWDRAKAAALPLTNDWLRIEADWKRLSHWIPWPADIQKPRMELSLHGRTTARDTNLVTSARLHFDKPLDLTLEPWNFPTNLVQDPLIGFTAAQGFRPWLSQQRVIKDLKIDTVPNQWFGWSLGNFPFLHYGAAPYPKISEKLQAMTPRVADWVKREVRWGNVGNIRWTTNVSVLWTNTDVTKGVVPAKEHLVWAGLPVMFPHLQGLPTPSGDFLFASMFPEDWQNPPAPAELVAQVVGRTNLAYYAWEITGDRLSHWRQVIQLMPLLETNMTIEARSPGQRWLTNLTTRLGNTGTEVRMVSKNELQLLRNSHLGMDGLELALLALWLDTDAFPLPAAYAPPRPPAPAAPPRPASMTPVRPTNAIPRPAGPPKQPAGTNKPNAVVAPKPAQPPKP